VRRREVVIRVLVTALMFLSLSSCVASLPPSAEYPGMPDQVAIDSAVVAWRVAGLPWSARCDAEYPRIRVVVSKPSEFTELCGRKPLHAGGRLYACNTEQHEHAFPWSVVDRDQVPLLVISRLQPEPHQHLLVVHETMHWLERCSGKGIDFDHEDDRVWADARIRAQHDTQLATLHPQVRRHDPGRAARR
jgi:hypothetical protein